MIVKDKFDSDDFESVQSPSKIGVLQYQCVSHDINNAAAKFRLVQAALSLCIPPAYCSVLLVLPLPMNGLAGFQRYCGQLVRAPPSFPTPNGRPGSDENWCT